MLRTPFSSPGYHTALKGGPVHPTRNSLQYAAALLDTGEAAHVQRACEILRRVIALQDQNPASKTYGIWSWFLEEPLDKMSPPDWNWADFCGTLLLQAALDHRDQLPADLATQLDTAIQHLKDSEARHQAQDIYRLAWAEIAHHFHPPTRQWAGPHSRCYRTLLDAETLALIQHATAGRLCLDWDELHLRIAAQPGKAAELQKNFTWSAPMDTGPGH